MRELAPGDLALAVAAPQRNDEPWWPERVSSYAIELVLPAYGEPADRAALERVLA